MIENLNIINILSMTIPMTNTAIHTRLSPENMLERSCCEANPTINEEPPSNVYSGLVSIPDIYNEPTAPPITRSQVRISDNGISICLSSLADAGSCDSSREAINAFTSDVFILRTIQMLDKERLGG